MKKIFAICILSLSANFISAQNIRSKVNFDDNWKFHLGHAKESSQNFNYGGHSCIDLKLFDDYKKLEKYAIVLTSKFDDKNWETINLPHDWAVGLPFVNIQPFEIYHDFHGSKAIGKEFPENSIGWYRKSFDQPATDSIFSFNLQFDGVFRNCKVFVNGFYVSSHFSGYTGFEADITGILNFGKSNQIVVMVDASQFEGWWYEGAGIYRHVWLNKMNLVHIPENGIFAYADISANKANLHIETTIGNKSFKPNKCEIQSYLINVV